MAEAVLVEIVVEQLHHDDVRMEQRHELARHHHVEERARAHPAEVPDLVVAQLLEPARVRVGLVDAVSLGEGVAEQEDAAVMRVAARDRAPAHVAKAGLVDRITHAEIRADEVGLGVRHVRAHESAALERRADLDVGDRRAQHDLRDGSIASAGSSASSARSGAFMRARGRLAQRGLERVGAALPVEAQAVAARGVAEPARARGIGEQVRDRALERARVARVDHAAGLAVDHHLGAAAASARHDRHAARARLDVGDPEALARLASPRAARPDGIANTSHAA